MVRDMLGDRMKDYYENRYKFTLTRRTPVIIRIDGKAFHSFTRHLRKPYDEIFHDAMNETLKYLCENIQGCKFGYTQSDEISLVLTDFDTLSTDAWFDYELQKMCSISASMATLQFNKMFREYADQYIDGVTALQDTDVESDYLKALLNCLVKGAVFDARCFNIPEDEIVNYFIWRQNDATRNAIRMLGYCHYSSKEIENVSNNDLQDMLFLEKGINFNDMDTEYKRGVCCYKDKVAANDRLCGFKTAWIIDTEGPIFTKDREYISKHIIKVYE